MTSPSLAEAVTQALTPEVLWKAKKAYDDELGRVLEGTMAATIEAHSLGLAAMRAVLMETLAPVIEQWLAMNTPNDGVPDRDGRLILNAYGRRCYDAGREAAERQVSALTERVKELETAVREHRDARGDDRCWMDDEALYRTLPEGFVPPERDSAVELDLCRQFIACRRNPATAYVSPQREIEKLQERVKELEQERTLLQNRSKAVQRGPS